MCGIYGYFHEDKNNVELSLLKKMGESIVHRGPDDEGIFVGAGVALGNRRLSIIDVNGGAQPFYSEDRNIIVVQNGEIYNYLELTNELKQEGILCKTKSDTEVILHLYCKYGIYFIKKLNGMFSIAIYDKRQDALFLIRDRLGVKPLYYYYENKLFLFASEIKALLQLNIPKIVNKEALCHFLSFNYILPPYTIFKNIYHVNPGTYVKVTPKGKEEIVWWDLSKIHTEYIESESLLIEEFNEILSDAVKLRLRADVPCGTFLSGGIDSSAVTGFISKFEKNVKSFCIGFEDSYFDESKYAEIAAKRFNTEHHLKIVKPEMMDLWPMAIYFCDQPHGDVSFLPTYCVSKLASDYLKVVLTGDGGDELFAGYDKYKDFFTLSDINLYSEHEFYKNYFEKITLFSEQAIRKLLKDKHYNENSSYDLYKNELDKVSHMDRINQALYFDCKYLLPGNNLVKPDRMGMAASVEARTPFLDYRMVLFAFNVPGKYKLRSGITKYICKKAIKDLIGDELLNRKKQMFTVPIGEWMKTNIGIKYKNLIMENNSICSDFFDLSYINKMFNKHLSGQKNFTRELRAIISFEIWGRIFIHNDYDKGEKCLKSIGN